MFTRFFNLLEDILAKAAICLLVAAFVFMLIHDPLRTLGILAVGIVGIILAIAILFAIVLGIGWLWQHLHKKREAALRSRLTAARRTMDWKDVEANLHQGHGTLILDWHHEWWTPDDLIAAAPITLPDVRHHDILDGIDQPDPDPRIVEYADACAERYLDEERGLALLTFAPVPPGNEDICCPVCRVGDRNLSAKYPNARIVTLVHLYQGRVLLQGDLAQSLHYHRDQPDQEGE